MKRNVAIASRLREVLLDGHWVANTNFKEQLSNTNREQATEKIGRLNSIAALTFHLNYYLAGLLDAFESGKLEISDKYSFDCPPMKTESDWIQLRDDFFNNSEKFVRHIEQMPDTQFDEPFIDKKYGNYQRNIEGVIEHSYYHLGQVSLIRKLIFERIQ